MMADPLPRRSNLPLPLQHHVQNELRPGETLVWLAQPEPAAFRAAYVGIFIFGLVWDVILALLLIALFFSRQPNIVHDRVWVTLFFIPFTLIGIGTLFSPVWLTRKARRTAYVVTDRRVFILTLGIRGGTTVESFAPDRLTSMSCRRRRDGSGDLIFEQFTTHAGSGVSTYRRGFKGIAAVTEVEWVILVTLLPDQVRTI